MKEAIGAYRQVTAANEFRELERQRERARHNEASALRHARVEGERRANEKWQSVVTDLRGTLAEQAALIGWRMGSYPETCLVLEFRLSMKDKNRIGMNLRQYNNFLYNEDTPKLASG